MKAIRIRVISIILPVILCFLLYSCFLLPMSEAEYFVASISQTKITASDGDYDDYFGTSVAMSSDGNSFIVGSPRDADNGSYSGSVYVYKWNGSTWEETKIIASDGQSYDNFGTSVSMSGNGNSFVVGAPDNIPISVYVYKWNGITWEETKVIASDGESYDYFGNSVSMSGDGNSFVVGAYKDDDNGNNSGSIYAYKWNGIIWEETKVIASDGESYGYFGNSISMSGDGNSFVVGAYGDDDNGSVSGSIYVYKWNGITWEETKVIASDGESYDYFGISVSISENGNSIVVGAHYDDDNGSFAGSVYVYKWNGTTREETKIIASDGTSDDLFGFSVSMSGDGNSIVVGAIEAGNLGSAYVCKKNGISWGEAKIPLSDNDVYAYFGYSVAISADGNSLVVGAPYNDNYSGAVYVYK